MSDTSNLKTIPAVVAEIEATYAVIESIKEEIDTVSIGLKSGQGSPKLAALHESLMTETSRHAALSRRLSALQHRSAADEAKADEAERARHMQQARVHAGRLIAAAANVDRLIRELRDGIITLGTEEREIWRALKLADPDRELTRSPVAHRHGLESRAVDRSLIMLNAGDRFTNRQPQDIAHMARVAWGDFVAEEGKNRE